MPTVKREIGGKRILVNIPYAPLDNVSFHCESNVKKWKYIFQRRNAREKELSKEAIGYKKIMELLKAAGMKKSVTNIGPCYEKLVKEFIVNIIIECNFEESKEYRKVYVRAKCVKFSPSIINEYLGKRTSVGSYKVPNIAKIAKEITGGQVKQLPKKRLLSS